MNVREFLQPLSALTAKALRYYRSYPTFASPEDQCEYYRRLNKAVPIFFFGFTVGNIIIQIVRLIICFLHEVPVLSLFYMSLSCVVQDMLFVAATLYSQSLINGSNSDLHFKHDLMYQRRIHKMISLCAIPPSLICAIMPLTMSPKVASIEFVWILAFLIQLQACTWLIDGLIYKAFVMVSHNMIFCGICLAKGYFTTHVHGRIMISVILSMAFFYTFERYKRENFIFRNLLKQQKNMYKEFLEKCQDPMIIATASKVIYFNEAARDKLKINETNFFSKSSFIMSQHGGTLSEKVQEAFNKPCKELVSKVTQEQYLYHDEESDLVASQRTLLVTIIPSLYYTQEPTIALDFHDGTEALLQEEKRVEEKYKNMLLLSLSHELLTPLNIFQGFLHTCKEFMQSDSAKEMRRNAKGAWCYLRNKIGDILDYAQIMSGEFSFHSIRFSLSRLVRYMRKITYNMLETKRLSVALDFHIHENVHDEFLGDKERLEQILFNFLSNSAKNTDSGKISLLIAHPPNDASTLEFSVIDTGCGMSPERVANLFVLKNDAQVAAKSAGLSGLGLTTSRLICGRMGTSIKVESEVGKGSKFYFRIPYHKHRVSMHNSSSSLAFPEEEPRANFCTFRGISARGPSTPAVPSGIVLIVDDNALNRLVVKKMVQKMGFTTEEADNGAIAVSKAEKIRMCPGIKWLLIFMDINMPVMDGIEATAEIRKKCSSVIAAKVFIVALSAFSAETERTKSMQVGMDSFIGKPLTKEKLICLFGALNLP